MREETRTIYKFSELSETAKQYAIEKYRDHSVDYEIHWQHELFESMKAVFDTAGIKIKDYQLGAYSYSYVKIDMDESIYNLTGARALGWIENNLLSKLRVTRAQYLKNRKDYFRYGYRIDKIKDCPLTGYCADHDFIDVLIESVKTGDCLGESFKLRLPETYVKLLEQEYEYQRSDEYITETIEANEYEFLESGEQL